MGKYEEKLGFSYAPKYPIRTSSGKGWPFPVSKRSFKLSKKTAHFVLH